jgi:hypothetical protein
VSIAHFVASLVVDCKYSDDNLEAALRDTYGENRSIVDSDIAAHTGALVGVTLTSTDSTSTFVVTNYNGAGPARDDPGVCIEKQELFPSLTQRTDYQVLQFSQGAAAVPLREVFVHPLTCFHQRNRRC